MEKFQKNKARRLTGGCRLWDDDRLSSWGEGGGKRIKKEEKTEPKTSLTRTRFSQKPALPGNAKDTKKEAKSSSRLLSPSSSPGEKKRNRGKEKSGGKLTKLPVKDLVSNAQSGGPRKAKS